MNSRRKSHLPGTFLRVVLIGLLGPAVVCALPAFVRLLDFQLSPAQPAPPTPSASGADLEFEVRSETSWQDTGVFIPAGSLLILEQVSGKWSECAAYGCPFRDANGNPDSSPFQDNNLVRGCLHASLVAQISGRQFCAGTSFTGRILQPGRLQLRINDNRIGDNEGAIVVHILVK